MGGRLGNKSVATDYRCEFNIVRWRFLRALHKHVLYLYGAI